MTWLQFRIMLRLTQQEVFSNMKKNYSEPDIEIISFKLSGDVLGMSTYNPYPEIGATEYDEGSDEDL